MTRFMDRKFKFKVKNLIFKEKQQCFNKIKIIQFRLSTRNKMEFYLDRKKKMLKKKLFK